MTPARLWTLELDKAAAGRSPTGRPVGLAGRWAMWRAVLLGVPAWLATALLFGREPSDPTPGPWAALHGEIANRTIPLLDLLTAQAPETPILLLGRPQRSLAAVGVLFAGRGLKPPRLFRPWTLGDALTTFGELVSVLTEGFHVAAARPAPLPPTREMAAIVYRLAQGLASRRWALRQGRTAGTVVFGHTGLADTSLLELGLQAAGARTVHHVHGVSQGWNFTGVSTLAVFQCESDARWHHALGGYGQTTALSTEAAEPHPDGKGWLVLSNRAHPMDPGYQARGLKAEVDLLRGVARAADLAGQPHSAVTWRPHPIFHSLPPSVQAMARREGERLGFVFWDPAGADLSAARDFALVVVSPSTAAIDMLRLGKLPVVFGDPGDPSGAVAQIPARAKDAPALAALAAELADPAQWQARYDAAWKAVGPGRKPDWPDLVAPLIRP